MKKSVQTLLLGIILLAYAAYAARFIQMSLFTVDGETYAALFDDAMISMTYARSLANGDGLVWHPGAERIEGFSNPLWVGFMALLHLLPIPQRLMSLPVMIAGGLFVLGCLLFIYKIANRLLPDKPLVALLAVLLTAFYYPLSNWSLLGGEVSVLLLIVAAAVWLALRSLDEGRVIPGLYGLLAISTFIRLDMGVPYLVILGWLWLFDRRNRWKHFAWGVGLLALGLGIQTGLRYAYYGEWLPMTYYLKVVGMPLNFRLLRGWYTLQDFIGGLHVLAFIFAFTVLIFRRDHRWLLAALIVAGQIAYSVYVGGDAWEHRGGANRFIALGMPFYWLLFSAAGWHWMDLVIRALGRWLKPLAGALAVAGRVLLVLVCVFALLFSNRYKNAGSPFTALRLPKEGALSYAFLTQRSYFVPGSERYTRDGLILNTVTTPEAHIAVTAAGAIIYFAERPGVDLFGKCDRTIAMMPARLDLMIDASNPSRQDILNLRPGHSKWRYEYSIGQLQPDVVVEVFPSTDEEAAPFLTAYTPIKLNNHTIYFKTGSPYVLWDKLPAPEAVP